MGDLTPYKLARTLKRRAMSRAAILELFGVDGKRLTNIIQTMKRSSRYDLVIEEGIYSVTAIRPPRRACPLRVKTMRGYHVRDYKVRTQRAPKYKAEE